ncbi:hypothetical protein, partial [Rudaea sp.]|uniref:hypothetical protein n=1 Tax=Rudaea sp. TaxID=2136325 RepID=UPI002ED1AB87
MRVDQLNIALRPRTPWEAADLGVALVRAHALRIYAAWVLITLPVFAVLNLVFFAVDRPWWAALVLWWFKPAFDRIPLFVISRAVFGEVPTLRETLHAQRDFGRRALLPWLTWRRLHPGRAMLIAVDMLEAPTGALRHTRVSVLAQVSASPNMLLTLLGANIEAVLFFSLIALGLMFVPVEFFSDSVKATWQTLFENPPAWAEVLANFLAWIAMSAVEPCFVGAGFGLYLNRRVQLEGWDIELAFRRTAARLAQGAAVLAFVVIGACMIGAAHAADDGDEFDKKIRQLIERPRVDEDEKAKAPTLEQLLGEAHRNDGKSFRDSVRQAYVGDDLDPHENMWEWKRRIPEPEKKDTPPVKLPWWAEGLGRIVGFIAQFGLWILFALLIVFLIAKHRVWLPWISARIAGARTPDELILGDEPSAPAALPDDLAAAVRALWREGRVREALALFYRGSVARLVEISGTPLPPGATEAD